MKPDLFAEGCCCLESGCFLANTYLLLPQSAGETRAVVIDPWRSETLYALLSERGISRLLVLLTHEHFDHTTGVNALRERFEVELVCHSACAESIAKARCNRPLGIMGREEEMRIAREIGLYTCSAERSFDDALALPWDGRALAMTHTPGHTRGSCCITVGGLCFCGDSALLGLPCITRFPGGSQAEYDAITLPYLLSLPETTYFLPGHGVCYHREEVVFADGAFHLNTRGAYE